MGWWHSGAAVNPFRSVMLFQDTPHCLGHSETSLAVWMLKERDCRSLENLGARTGTRNFQWL